MTIPILLFAGPAIGYFAGNWLDLKMGWFPWGTIVGVLLGIASAVREIARILMLIQRDEKKSR